MYYAHLIAPKETKKKKSQKNILDHRHIYYNTSKRITIVTSHHGIRIYRMLIVTEDDFAHKM